MNVKTKDLQGTALDWAVGVAHEDGGLLPVAYSTDWQFGGPIIEGELIDVFRDYGDCCWRAESGRYSGAGLTPLVAAMRCYVASKLGDEVQVPREVL